MSGARTDAGLALLTLAVFVAAFLISGGRLSIPFLIAGAFGTLVFELLATRRSEAVRAVWERRSVQVVAVGLAILIAIVGSAIAPDRILAAGIGALLAYLGGLAIVVTVR